MGLFWNEGEEPRWEKKSLYTPGQERLLSQDIRNTRQLGGGGYQDAMSILSQYLNPQSSLYQSFEQPYLNQFNQQIIPGLAERFAGMNAMGGGVLNSGFGQALGAAGANLQTQLAALKQGYQRQSINDLLNQYNQATNRGLGARAFENIYHPGTQGQPGILGNILGSGLSAAGTALGGPLGGWAASAGGGLIGSLFGSGQNYNPFAIG